MTIKCKCKAELSRQSLRATKHSTGTTLVHCKLRCNLTQTPESRGLDGELCVVVIFVCNIPCKSSCVESRDFHSTIMACLIAYFDVLLNRKWLK